MSDSPPVDRYCPKCMSNRVYVDGDFLACRTCGNRWNPNFKPITKTEDEEMALDKDKLKELHAAGKTDKEIAEALNAKVGTVWAARKALGLKPNNSRKHSPRKSLDRPGRLSPDKIKEVKTVKAINMSHVGEPDTAFVIGIIDVQIEEYRKRIDRLTQAKSILSA